MYFGFRVAHQTCAPKSVHIDTGKLRDIISNITDNMKDEFLRGRRVSEEQEFWLYDLKVETVLDGRTPVCRHVEGESFTVEGENLVFQENQRISMYALAALLPLLPAKQRETSPEDWMSTDAEIACPDPHCGGRFRITRLAKRRFTHTETTGLPDERQEPYWQKDAGV